jgi:hypothetical protein
MSAKISVWPWVFLSIWWVVGCAAGPQTSTPPDACEMVEEKTAVYLTLLDDQDAPLEQVLVRYSHNDGPWIALPEPVNGRALIPGQSGVYQIRAVKVAYETAETTVTVPEPSQPSCPAPAQEVTLRLVAAVCPIEPESLALRLLQPEKVERVKVTAVMPDGSHMSLTCQPDSNDCRAYELPLTQVGGYQLILDDLPATGPIFLEDGILNYDWLPYEVYLSHAGQNLRLNGERANRLMLDFTVTPDEGGCAQPDFQSLTVVQMPEVESTAPFPSTRVHQLGGLLMTDLSAEVCQQPPVLTTVAFEVVVPAGTPLAEVDLLYGLDGRWQRGECELENGRLLCNAQFPNPFINQPYAVKAIVAGQEHIANQLPFSNLCIVFR